MKRFITNFLWLPFTVIAAGTNDLPELAPPYGELTTTFWEQHQTAIMIASFAFLAVSFLLVKMLRRPENPKILPPEALARQALSRLQGRLEDGTVLSEVSLILRRYFSAAFGLPATEMTTAEFCAALTNNETIGGKLAQMISDFVHVCDKDKFSPKSNAPPINAVDRAGELISLSEARRTQPAKANPPQQ